MKTVIILESFLLACIAFIPFFLVLILLGAIDSIDWGTTLVSFATGTEVISLLSAFSTSPFFFICESIILICGIAFALGVFGYKTILFYMLANSYLKGEKLGFKRLCSLTFLKKYICLFPSIFGILSLPILLYILYFFLIVFLFGGFQEISNIVNASPINTVSILLLIGFISMAISFFYIYYRLIFSYVILCLGEPDGTNTRAIIEDSISRTKKGMLCMILAIILCYGIPKTLLSSYKTFTTTESQRINTYISYKNLESLDETDFARIQTGYASYEDLGLSVSFMDLDQDYKNIEASILLKKSKNYALQGRVLSLVEFLIFYGLFEVLILTLYIRQTGMVITGTKKAPLIARIRNKIFQKKS